MSDPAHGEGVANAKGPPAAVKIPRAELLELATRAGVVLDSERKDLLPYHLLLVFEKP